MSDDLDLMRKNVVELHGNPAVLALRVSREHYLLMADEVDRLKRALDSAIREREDWNGKHQLACLSIQKLEAVRDAARAVNDESGPDLSPSLGSMAKLAEALHSEWLWRQDAEPNPRTPIDG